MPKETKNKFIRKKGVVFQEVDGLVHILDEKDDAIITLNQTSSFLWKRLSKPSSLEDLAKNLISEFKVKFSKAIKDCEEFLEKMEKRKLLTKI